MGWGGVGRFEIQSPLPNLFLNVTDILFTFEVSNESIILSGKYLFGKSEKRHESKIRPFDNDKTFLDGTGITLMAMDRLPPV